MFSERVLYLKRIVCLIIASAFIFVSGCNTKGSDVTAVTTGLKFTATAKTEYGENIFNVKISGENQAEITCIDDQKELFTALIAGEDICFKYFDLEKESSVKALPKDSLINIIYSIMCDVKHDTALEYQNDQYYLDGKTENGYSYKIFFGATGLPFCIEETNQNITINLKNVTVV